jgi:MFS transporter
MRRTRRPQSVEQHRQQARRPGLVGVFGASADPVPEPQQVARLEVGANRAGSLRGLEHAGHRLAERVLAVPPERLGLPVDRRLQRRGQAGTLDDEPHQRLLRRQLLRERARLARELLDLAALDGLSEHVARREVPIERAGADAGALGDVVQRRVDALLEEDLAGGGHDPLVALPRVRADLGFPPAGLSWVMNAYTLVFGGLLLLGGRLGDLFGRRRVFLAGVAVFTVASLAGGLADSAGLLVAARIVQGLGPPPRVRARSR